MIENRVVSRRYEELSFRIKIVIDERRVLMTSKIIKSAIRFIS
jgi:hypothetical protein